MGLVEGSDVTASRKLDHIKMVVSSSVESLESDLFEYVRLIHNPLPEMDLDDVDLSVEFCFTGKRLRYPLMITGMTGGHPDVAWINGELASLAEEYGIAFGVGSQRAAIEDPRVSNTYSIAREKAPNAVIVANIGAPQISREYGVKEAKRAVEMVKADALAIHLNPGQEAFQDEGDPYYSNVLEGIKDIADRLDVPVIVKETGTGIPYEVVKELRAIGVKCIDVSGLGGTNWIKVEVLRSKTRYGEARKPAGPLSDYWGNPTAISIIEARLAAPDSFIIGSGGIRNGLEAVKAIALGADIAGIALPVLRALLNGGKASAKRLIEGIIYQVKAAAFMTSSKRLYDLWKAPLVIHGRLLDELSVRSLNPHTYIYRVRTEALMWRMRNE